MTAIDDTTMPSSNVTHSPSESDAHAVDVRSMPLTLLTTLPSALRNSRSTEVHLGRFTHPFPEL